VDASIKRIADLVELMPDIQFAATNPPDVKLPHLRCFFFFDVDKEHSRKASRLAIPQLLEEINVLKQPQQAEQTFVVMALDPDLFYGGEG